jgi:hypothetical protein
MVEEKVWGKLNDEDGITIKQHYQRAKRKRKEPRGREVGGAII